MGIPTTGTGAVESTPKTIGGKDYANVNLGNFVSFLDNIHQVNLVDVRNFKGWYFGGPNSKLDVSGNMKIEPLNTNAIGNLGLVNRQKIQMRQHSVIFHHLFKNAVSRSSYTSFLPDKKDVHVHRFCHRKGDSWWTDAPEDDVCGDQAADRGRSPHNVDAH